MAYSELKKSTLIARVKKMVDLSTAAALNLDNITTNISKGNTKTGALVPSVSLIPVHDCNNCATCSAGCYAVRNVCWRPSVQKNVAENSALARNDRDRYFNDIERAARGARFFRFHVSGDVLDYDYFSRMVEMAKKCPWCTFLAFTKDFKDVNRYIAINGSLPENLKIIFSDWRGLEMPNPYNFPISSPVWFDKETGKEVERGPHCTNIVKWCGGDCSECAINGAGCWTLKPGETVLFKAH